MTGGKLQKSGRVLSKIFCNITLKKIELVSEEKRNSKLCVTPADPRRFTHR